jgi:cell division protein FtsI/penicillin-binding protein 2
MSVERRISVLVIVFFLLSLLILCRLFYWQIVKANRSQELAWDQYRSVSETPAIRGDILATDEFPLAISEKAYLLYANPLQLKEKPQDVVAKLMPVLSTSIELEEYEASQASSVKKDLLKEVKEQLISQLLSKDLMWLPLWHNLNKQQEEAIQGLNIAGLGFQDEQARFYPEASMAAHLLGFVGKDESGQNKGYFGLEGFYDLELKGRPGMVFQEKDAANNPILIGSFINQEKKDGKNLILSIDRTIQLIIEQDLKEAIERYRAKAGYVAVMDPVTGEIVAMAAYPSYNPQTYFKFDKTLYKNPMVADTYEPGSTFKIFVMSAALDRGLLKPDTKCNICDGPFKIDKYTIRTWDDKYYPDSTMTEVIQHSDNVGMVFVGQKLGMDQFWHYIRDFGFGEKTNIDLQEEVEASIKDKNKWNDVDLATAAFGQGMAVTGIQTLRAAAAIANGGKLLEPHIVKQIISGDKVINVKPKIIRQVIKPETAKTMTEIMVNAVVKGESQWTKLPGYKIAGKTGTAQVPIAGHYDKDKTIASFIGFGPAEKPKFVMLVSLREPQTSPWASETAAPLFFKIAKEMLVYYGIQPD